MGVVWFLAGAVIGSAVTYVIFKRRQHSIGTIRVDRSIPDEGPYLFLELTSSGADEIMRGKKRVIMDVKLENYISHE